MDPRSSVTTGLLVAGAAGAVLFVLVLLVEGATRPGYDAARQSVSALSLGERGWVQVTSFVLTGAAMCACAAGVRRALPDVPGSTWGPLLLAVFGVGLVAAGAFVMDPPVGSAPGPHEAGRSWHGLAHDVASLVVFTALPAAAFVLARALWHLPTLQWLAVASVAAGTLVVGLLVVFVAADGSGSAVAGAWQRATIVVGWAWVAVLGTTLALTAPLEHP